MSAARTIHPGVFKIESVGINQDFFDLGASRTEVEAAPSVKF